MHDSSRHTFTTQDHPPPQHISGDSAQGRLDQDGRARPRHRVHPAGTALATGRILSSAAADDGDASGRPGDRVTV